MNSKKNNIKYIAKNLIDEYAYIFEYQLFRNKILSFYKNTLGPIYFFIKFDSIIIL